MSRLQLCLELIAIILVMAFFATAIHYNKNSLPLQVCAWIAAFLGGRRSWTLAVEARRNGFFDL